MKKKKKQLTVQGFKQTIQVQRFWKRLLRGGFGETRKGKGYSTRKKTPGKRFSGKRKKRTVQYRGG